MLGAARGLSVEVAAVAACAGKSLTGDNRGKRRPVTVAATVEEFTVVP